MRYIQGAVLAVVIVGVVSPLWAADEAASGFYALRALDIAQPDSSRLKPLSDAELGTVEGSSRFSGLGRHDRIGARTNRMLTYLVFRLLSDLFHSGGGISVSGQKNFLVQLNIAIGNYITQTNNAVQYNVATSGQLTR